MRWGRGWCVISIQQWTYDSSLTQRDTEHFKAYSKGSLRNGTTLHGLETSKGNKDRHKSWTKDFIAWMYCPTHSPHTHNTAVQNAILNSNHLYSNIISTPETLPLMFNWMINTYIEENYILLLIKEQHNLRPLQILMLDEITWIKQTHVYQASENVH